MKMKRFQIHPFFIMLIALLVLNAVRGGFTMQALFQKLLLLPGILIGLTFHEFAHAFVSDRLGDPTPSQQGRVTLNPLRHIDPIGFIALFFAGFGWGVPVQIDPRYYRHRRRDEAFVACAGVAMNFLIAFFFLLIMRGMLTLLPYGVTAPGSLGELIFQMLNYAVFINIVLMIFNLLPIPPLDGFNLLTQIFDLRRYSWYYPLMQQGFWILIFVVLVGLTDRILNPLVSLVYNFMSGTVLGGIL